HRQPFAGGGAQEAGAAGQATRHRTATNLCAARSGVAPQGRALCACAPVQGQRTILGRVLRDLQRKLAQLEPSVRERIGVWLERAQRLLAQRPKDKQKLYALHAPEVDCMSKGKARQPYECGVKVGIAVSARKGLIVGARSFPGHPYDGDTLAEQLEQARGLLQDVNVIP
ncbi:IS5/IS1182 family transposase, partial [Xanthomonas oryzae pv. oryzae]